MPSLPRTGLTYPSRAQPRAFDILERFYQALDSILYAHREDRNLVLMGGGTLSWNATTGQLSFTQDIVLLSPNKGWAMTIDQSTYSPITNIGDGSIIYVEVTRAPGAGVSLVPRVSNVVPNNNNAVLIGYRTGTVLYLRNGTGFDNGDSGTIYGGGSGASSITGWSRHQITVGTNGDAWFDKTQSVAAQGTLTSDFSDALFSPASVHVYINNTLCHYTSDVSAKDLNWWRWVVTDTPAPVIELGSTGSAPQAGDIVTIQYPR